MRKKYSIYIHQILLDIIRLSLRFPGEVFLRSPYLPGKSGWICPSNLTNIFSSVFWPKRSTKPRPIPQLNDSEHNGHCDILQHHAAMVRNSRHSRSDYFPLITAITESHSTNLRWMCSEWYSFIVMFIICLYDIIWYYIYMINLYRSCFIYFSHAPIWFKHPDPWRILTVLVY